MRAIVLDDDAAPGLGATLESVGFSTDVYTHVAPALARIATLTYDVAVVDIRLPDGNGISFIRALREAGHPTKCILVSGYSEPFVTFEAGQLHVERYLPKPFDRDQLATIALELVGSTRADSFRNLVRLVGAPFLQPGRPPAMPGELLRTCFRLGGAPRISLPRFEAVARLSRAVVAGSAECRPEGVLAALDSVAAAGRDLPPLVQTALSVMAASRQRGMGKIAASVGCSSRELREALASTSRDCRRWNRLAHVMRGWNALIDRHQLPSQAAYAAGYSNLGQFDRDCRLESGVTPSVIRRLAPSRASGSEIRG